MNKYPSNAGIGPQPPGAHAEIRMPSVGQLLPKGDMLLLSSPAFDPGNLLSTNGDLLLRLRQIIGPGNLLPISRSSFYKLARGRLKKVSVPAVRVALWRKSDILELLHAGRSVNAPSLNDGEVEHG